MWNTEISYSDDKRCSSYRLLENQNVLSYDTVITLWEENATFRTWFNQLLADSAMSAYRWETPPITNDTVGREFQFVLLRSNGLQRPPDRNSFASKFKNVSGSVSVFKNLSGDATLVVPSPVSEEANYVHLAGFVRTAPSSQIDEFWKAVGVAARERLCDQRFWLSTAGMGVAWLHVRLDDRPKYYGHGPFRNE